MAHPMSGPLKPRVCPTRATGRGGPRAPGLQRPTGPGPGPGLRDESRRAGTASRGRALSPLQSEMRRTRGRGGRCERADTCRPQPSPARTTLATILRKAGRRSSRRKGSGRHHREPAAGEGAPPPSLPGPWSLPARPFPVPLARPLRVPLAVRAAVMAGRVWGGGGGGGRTAVGLLWERLALSPTTSAGT